MCEEIEELLDLDLGSSSFHLLLELFGFGFADGFTKSLWCTFNKLLGFGKAESSNRCAHFLNDGDLVAASFGENNVEFGLLFFRSRSNDRTSGGGHRCSSAYAPLFFECLDKVRHFEDGHAAEFFYDFI